jgi:glycosyltransferase involved in cell wall biosynthesis
MSKKTLCFITMCKNEEHCIKTTLESVYKFIDYWIVCDTGSTDKTCEIITEFFKEKNIPGELFIDEWKGFDKNKSLMFERAYNKTDYVLHLDADDFLVGDLNKELLNDTTDDKFMFNYVRGSSKFITSSLYSNRLKWIYVGVAHNLILCTDKKNITTSHIFTESDMYVDNNERGARKFDPNKYIKDALILKEQFFETLYEDPHGLRTRSVFYTGQSYMDCEHYKEAIQWYTLYTNLKDTWIEELFESYLRLGSCMIKLKLDEIKIKYHLQKAIDIFPDRAEPYFILGKYYNNISNTELGYMYLKEAKNKDLDAVLKKYVLFVNKTSYGKYVNDELSVACFWRDKAKEGFSLLNEIIDDPDFEGHKERLLQNKEHFLNKYPSLSLP